MSTHKDQLLLVISIFILVPQCLTQNCRYVKCDPPQCSNPVSIPGRCCHVCPPTGNTAPQGRCPRADISFTCGDHCQTDTDCSNNRKCCDHGCGKSCRHTVTVSSGSCPYGGSIPSTDCEKLSGIPCPVGYYCKYSLTSGLSECCTSAEYSTFQPHPCASAVCSAVYCANTHIPQGQCCPVCTPEPALPATPAPVPPTQAPPLLDSIACMFSFCQTVNCPNSYIPPGECCPVCPVDPCANAQCPLLSCTNSYRPDGQCCPVCPELNCFFNGNTYSSGQTFPNGCNNCTCSNGHIYCSNHTCVEPCHQNGVVYDSGSTVYDSPCQTCTCGNGIIYCTEDICKGTVPPTPRPTPRPTPPPTQPPTQPPTPRDPCSGRFCRKVNCPVTYQPMGECCPSCLNPGDCLYEGQMFKNGAVKRESCQKCTCMDGLMVCSNDCIQQVTLKPKTQRPKTYPTPSPPKRRPPPPPSRKALFKRGPPPRPPPPLKGKSGTGSMFDQAQSGPPLSFQSYQEMTVPKDPSTAVQTYPTPPTFRDAQIYEPPPRSRQSGPVQVPVYPDVQSTQNKPVPAEMHQTYPKKEAPKKPLQLDPYLFEQAPKNQQLQDKNYQNVQPPFHKQNFPETGQPPQYPKPLSGAPPPPPGPVYPPQQQTPGSQSQFFEPPRLETYPPPTGWNNQPSGSESQYPKPPSQSRSYRPPPGQKFPSSQHDRDSMYGTVISQQTGPKSRDQRCLMVSCPQIACPNFEIRKGECCPNCLPAKELKKKAGSCPPVRRAGVCVNLCKTDFDCIGMKICCQNGCGGTQCFDPVLKKTINKQKR